MSEDAPTPAWLKRVAPEWKKVESWWQCSGDQRRRPTTQRLASPCWLQCGKDIKVFLLGQNPKKFQKYILRAPHTVCIPKRPKWRGLSKYTLKLLYLHFLKWCVSLSLYFVLSSLSCVVLFHFCVFQVERRRR